MEEIKVLHQKAGSTSRRLQVPGAWGRVSILER